MLENNVKTYQQTKSDEVFRDIYNEVRGWWSNKQTIAKSIGASEHEVQALYEDVLMKSIERYDGKSDFMRFYKKAVTLERANLYRSKRRRRQQEVYQSASDEAATLEETLADDFDLETETIASIIAKKKADQRQLIDFLLNGADDFTAATVKAFLQHPKPSATAIAKELGVHHSKVIRALTRLAAKYDSTIFGEHRDYLFAH